MLLAKFSIVQILFQPPSFLNSRRDNIILLFFLPQCFILKNIKPMENLKNVLINILYLLSRPPVIVLPHLHTLFSACLSLSLSPSLYLYTYICTVWGKSKFTVVSMWNTNLFLYYYLLKTVLLSTWTTINLLLAHPVLMRVSSLQLDSSPLNASA